MAAGMNQSKGNLYPRMKSTGTVGLEELAYLHMSDYLLLIFRIQHTHHSGLDVVDGPQRIRTIWSFYDDEFPLAKDAEPVNGIDVAGKKYSELDFDVASIIDSYNIDFVILDIQNEEEIREIFLRLQNGTTLKAQEKRNAMPGHMRDFVRELTR